MQKVFSLADQPMNKLADQNNQAISREALVSQVNYLLLRMCDIMAYHIDSDNKGATCLEYDNARDHFTLLTQVRHESLHLEEEVKNFRRDNSMAGQALNSSEVIVWKDCRRTPPKDIKWFSNSVPPRFISRAVAPIQLSMADGKTVDLGVICLDTRHRHKLDLEDKAIMMMIADKVAMLWKLHLPAKVAPTK